MKNLIKKTIKKALFTIPPVKRHFLLVQELNTSVNQLNNRIDEYNNLIDEQRNTVNQLKEKIGEEYLIPLLGVYDSFDEIII